MENEVRPGMLREYNQMNDTDSKANLALEQNIKVNKILTSCVSERTERKRPKEEEKILVRRQMAERGRERERDNSAEDRQRKDRVQERKREERFGDRRWIGSERQREEQDYKNLSSSISQSREAGSRM